MSVAMDMGVSANTVRKWVEPYQAEAETGLLDRASRPHRLRCSTPQPVVRQIETLRRQGLPGKQIANIVRVAAATVSRVLQRLGISKGARDGRAVRRYERQQPGELIHIDIKSSAGSKRSVTASSASEVGGSDHHGRSAHVGWEHVHVCIDDASRIAFIQILPDEKKESAVAFLRAAIAYYANLGVTVTRVMTDNDVCYRSTVFRATCKALGLNHIRTRPYTPGPTARPGASFRPASENGPSPKPVPPQITAPPSSRSDCANTTGIDPTAA